MSDRLCLSRMRKLMLNPRLSCPHWVPKYRFRVLKGAIAQEVFNCVQVYSSRLGCQVVGLKGDGRINIHTIFRGRPRCM